MPLAIKTERLLIRGFQFEDWPDIREVLAKPEVTAFDSPYPLDENGIQAVVRHFVGNADFAAVLLAETNRFIGHLHFGIRPELDDGTRNLGFVFDSDYWGRGMACESCQALLRFAFEELGAPGFLTGTRRENLRACRLLERLQFLRIPNSDPEGYLYRLTHGSHPTPLPVSSEKRAGPPSTFSRTGRS